MAKYYSSTRIRPECPTCGNKIGQLEESFKRLQEQGKSPAEALEALDVQRPCCRVRVLWPVVLPVGAFYLPHHEAAMQNYLFLKEPPPQPNLVVLSLRRAATGENFIVSHVDQDGFIGEIASGALHEPTEIAIKVAGESRKIVMKDDSRLTQECSVRVQTEPGEITRGFPFETRAFRKDIEVNKIKSYFDLPLEEQPDTIEGAPPPDIDQLIADEDYLDEDEPLVDTGGMGDAPTV